MDLYWKCLVIATITNWPIWKRYLKILSVQIKWQNWLDLPTVFPFWVCKKRHTVLVHMIFVDRSHLICVPYVVCSQYSVCQEKYELNLTNVKFIKFQTYFFQNKYWNFVINELGLRNSRCCNNGERSIFSSSFLAISFSMLSSSSTDRLILLSSLFSL